MNNKKHCSWFKCY